MRKEVVESNIFFNYAVKLVFKDCIFPILKLLKNTNYIEFIVSIDNRNVSVGNLNNLKTYLMTEFCLKNYDFKVTYYDSASNYCIQLADLIVNTIYNSYKDVKIVKKVVPKLNPKRIRISTFPGRRINEKLKKRL